MKHRYFGMSCSSEVNVPFCAVSPPRQGSPKAGFKPGQLKAFPTQVGWATTHMVLALLHGAQQHRAGKQEPSL